MIFQTKMPYEVPLCKIILNNIKIFKIKIFLFYTMLWCKNDHANININILCLWLTSYHTNKIADASNVF